jgi:hypothetical protein
MEVKACVGFLLTRTAMDLQRPEGTKRRIYRPTEPLTISVSSALQFFVVGRIGRFGRQFTLCLV